MREASTFYVTHGPGKPVSRVRSPAMTGIRAKKRVKAGTSRRDAAVRRAKFIEAYIENGRNATQAAVTAGFASKSARVTGSQLLADPNISEEILRRTETELAAVQRKSGISIERTLREAARLTFYDMGRLFDENNKLKDPRDWDEETAAAVASFDVVEVFQRTGKDRILVGYVKKVRFFDKNAALEKLMKHFGLYEKDNVQMPLPPTFVIVGVEGKLKAKGKKD